MNIFRNFQVSILVADNVLVIIALPETLAGCTRYCIKPFGHRRFKPPHNIPHRRGALHAPWLFIRVRAFRVHAMGPRAIGADAIRPYELDDTVDVIGHDDKFVQYDMGTDTFCFAPFFI
ncbi:MAG: hypothetical protein IT528_03325, partial [Nitrosomonas sp.]|nr:hypothetical protein [Nitrosomonas sp.]